MQTNQSKFQFNKISKKSFLSNPKFVPIVKNQQNDNKNNSNKNSKTFQDQGLQNKNEKMP